MAVERAEGAASGTPVERLSALFSRELRREGDAAPEEPEGEEPAPEPDAEAEGEEAPEGEGEQPDDQPETEETVEVEGQEEPVTIDELTKGYLRQADYTQKTQALAADRRQFEEQRAGLMRQREQEVVHLQGLAQTLERELQSLQPDWNTLKEENPIEYVRQREEWRERNELLARTQQHQAEIIQQQLAQRIPEERRLLGEKYPAWKEPKAFEKGYRELSEWLVGGGWVSPDEWNQVIDHRLVLLAQKAKEHDDLARKTPVATKKVQALPRIQRASAPRQAAQASRYEAAMKRLRQTGSTEDAAAALLARFS